MPDNQPDAPHDTPKIDIRADLNRLHEDHGRLEERLRTAGA